MLLAAARRITVICVPVVRGDGRSYSALLGLAAGAGIERSVSVGLYLLGALLLGCCFIFEVRGPLRGVSEKGETVPLLGARRMRRAPATNATRPRMWRAALFVAGIRVIVLGSMIDPTHRAF